MTEIPDNIKDTQRAFAAAKVMVDGREMHEWAKILVTAEHTFAAILLTCTGGDARKAASMLNEGLIPGIERRIALYASKGDRNG